jgi:hypothetical protein
MRHNLKRPALAAALACALLPAAGGQTLPAGCRLGEDDPLRAEVNTVMKAGADFESQQRAALRDKISQLGRAKGWSTTEEEAYFRKVVLVGNAESWDQMLTVAAAFIRVCEEQDDGNQRAEAVRLFRELYVVEERQWRTIHESVDRDLAASRRD